MPPDEFDEIERSFGAPAAEADPSAEFDAIDKSFAVEFDAIEAGFAAPSRPVDTRASEGSMLGGVRQPSTVPGLERYEREGWQGLQRREVAEEEARRADDLYKRAAALWMETAGESGETDSNRAGMEFSRAFPASERHTPEGRARLSRFVGEQEAVRAKIAADNPALAGAARVTLGLPEGAFPGFDPADRLGMAGRASIDASRERGNPVLEVAEGLSRGVGMVSSVGALPGRGALAQTVKGAGYGAASNRDDPLLGALETGGTMALGMGGTRALAPAGSGALRTAGAATVAGTGAETVVRTVAGEDITLGDLAKSAVVNLGLSGPDIIQARRTARAPSSEASPDLPPSLRGAEADVAPPPQEAPQTPPEALPDLPPSMRTADAPVETPRGRDSASAATATDAEVRSQPPLEPRLGGRGDAVEPPVEAPTPLPDTPPSMQGDTTSVKNRVVAAEREARGAPERVPPTPETHAEWLDRAQAILRENPRRGDELTAELTQRPRPPTDEEHAVLQIHRRTLRNAEIAADEAGKAAAARGDADAVAEAEARSNRAEADLIAAEVASFQGGTEWGRSGSARQMELAQDFSLARMTARAMKQQGYRELSPEQKAEVKALHDRIATSDARVAALEERFAAIEAKRALGKVAVRASRTKYGETNRGVTREGYEAAKASLRAKLGGVRTGVPLDAIPDLVKMGAFHVEAGVRGFARWSARMVKDAGEAIRPHLRTLYAESLKQAPAVKDETGLAEAGKIAELVMRDGIRNREAVIDEVHAIIKETRPETTRREVMDAISGYGKVRPLNPEPVKAELRELKGQMQQLAKLADMAAGKAPLKSGPERQAPGDEQRRLIKEVNEAKRVGGYDVRDPASQLRSALDATKTRLTHDIADLDRQIAAGKREVTQRTPLTLDAEATALKARRDALKKVLDALDPRVKPARTEAQRIQTAMKAVERATAEYVRRVQTGDLDPKRKVDEAFEARKQKALARARAEQDTARQAWQEALVKQRLKNRTPIQKAVDVGREVLNLPRHLMTALDFSAVLAQGGINTLSHPLRAARALPAMFRAFRSKEGQARSEAEIRANPNYLAAKKAGVFFSEHGNVSLTQMEEAYMSRWVGKFPLVAGTQRAYQTFLNRIRMDAFDGMARSLSRTGVPTPKEAKAIADYINITTGRSTLGPNSVVAGMNTFLFAPRLLASRFQFLGRALTAGQLGRAGSLRMRGMLAGEWARLLGGLGVVYGLGALSGGEIETDPRSSDFGKIRFGTTRLDPLMGLSQVATFLARMGTGETKGQSGRIVPIRGEGTPFGGDAATVAGRFLRTKLAPTVGAAVDLAAGRNVVGEKVTPGTVAAGFLPLSGRDIAEAMEAQGVPRGTVMGILSIFGMRMQDYEAKKGRK